MSTTARLRPAVACLAFLAVAFAACGDAEQSAPVPSSLTVVSGDGQTGTVGAALSAALTVVVRDDGGQPVAGFTVTWAVTTGGGTLAQTSTTTGSDGHASTTWTLGGNAGTQTVTASGSGDLSATFSSTAEAGPPAQVGISGTTTLDALQATTKLTGRVEDAFGNPLTGEVAWASADENVATVASDGTVTAQANGTAEITATSGELSGAATVTVAQKAATLAVSPTNPVTSVGGTIQLTATGKDANGFDVAGVTASWSSATTSVATVDSTGLATGVAEGQSVITATSGSATGTATLTVSAAPFEPNEDMTVDGDVTAASINVPAGVTVTLTNGATLSSGSTLTVAGTITGDCVATALAAGTDLTVTGTVRNSCSDSLAAPQDLTLTAGGAIVLTDAVLESSGGVTIDNTGAAAVGPRSGAALRAPSPCDLTRARVSNQYVVTQGTLDDGTATKGATGNPGKDLRATCSGDMTLRQAIIWGQSGRWGGTKRVEEGTAIGGDGGRGSDIFLTASGNITFARTGVEDPTYLVPGGGGQGGAALTAGTAPEAFGGVGGRAGLPFVQAGGSIIIEEQAAVRVQWKHPEFSDTGGGGRGGLGLSEAAHGADATGGAPAQRGRDAMATGGKGGSLGLPDEQTTLIGDLFKGTVTNPTFIFLDGSAAGKGGGAEGRAGNGGKGDETHPDGADAGTTTLIGGEGGEVTLFDNRGNVFVGTAGDGGGIAFGDQTSAPASIGGSGWSDCRVGSISRGGAGGSGGTAIGRSGEGGFRGANRTGSRGPVNYYQYGNGGTGGDGVPAGSGGAAGDNLLVVGPVLTVVAPSLQRGADGNPCAIIIEPAISVDSDENGHAPFIGLSAVNRLTVTLGADGQITISGNGPWVTLTGTVGADGSFEVTGTGSVAGFPGTAVSFTGMLSLDADGRVTGIASGTLTMDATNSVLPPNEDGVRNPAIYKVSGGKIG